MIVKIVPETTYHRGAAKPLPEKSNSAEKFETEKSHVEVHEEPLPVPRKKTYLEELSIYNGIYPTNVSVWSLLARPFLACLTPVCLWAGLLYGVAITWLVLIATGVAQLFSAARKLPLTILWLYLQA